MTAPQFPAAWGQPPAPAAAQAPGYPPQQFAPPAQQAYGQYPTPPQQLPPPPVQYPPAQPAMYGALPAQGIPGYPMPGQYPPAPPQYGPAPVHYQDPYAPPSFQPAGGTLDEYANQRPAGAQYWKFGQPGTPAATNIGMVERDLRDSDVQQVTFKGQPVRRPDQSISQEKSLNLPMVNQDGSKAIWEVKGADRTLLTDTCRAAGVESGLPEGGSMLKVTHTHTEASRGGGSPRKVKTIEYVRPGQVSAAPVQQSLPQPAPQAAPPQAPAPQQAPPPPPQPVWDGQQWTYPQAAPVAAPQQAAPAQYAVPPAAPAYPQQAAPAQPSPQGPPPPVQYAPPGMAPEHAAQFAGLMGGAAQQ